MTRADSYLIIISQVSVDRAAFLIPPPITANPPACILMHAAINLVGYALRFVLPEDPTTIDDGTLTASPWASPVILAMAILVAVVAIMLLRREFRRRPRSLPLQTSAIGGGIAH